MTEMDEKQLSEVPGGESSANKQVDPGTELDDQGQDVDEIAPAPIEDSHSDIYDAEPEPVLTSAEKKKKKGAVEDVVFEPPPPPPYSGPAAVAKEEPKKKPYWKRRWFLLLAIGLLIVIVVVVATVLGVVLSRNHGSSTSNSASTSSNPSSPTSNPTEPSTPLPTPTTRSGDASPPLNNTGLAAVTVMNPGNLTNNGYGSFVKVLFQDDAGYLSEKSSTNGASIWNVNDSGNRIMQVLNGTPISAASSPQEANNNLPIRVFFINTDGFLADVYQDIYGGTWTNGSLADRRFQPYAAKDTGITHRSLSASWCDGESLTLFVEADDLTINAFQLTTTKTTSSWSLIPGKYGNIKDISSSMNFASVCGFDGLGVPPLFVNYYGGNNPTGSIYTWWNNTNTSVTLPSTAAPLYRPNSPIGVAFTNIPTYSPAANYKFILFYPLPTSLTSVSPNPSLHYTMASPYPPGTLNWTGAVDVDTHIVPFALGAKALFDPQTDLGSPLSVDDGVDASLPRAWMPLALEWSEEGRVVVVYQSEGGGLKVGDVIGGVQGGSYDVIVAT